MNSTWYHEQKCLCAWLRRCRCPSVCFAMATDIYICNIITHHLALSNLTKVALLWCLHESACLSADVWRQWYPCSYHPNIWAKIAKFAPKSLYMHQFIWFCSMSHLTFNLKSPNLHQTLKSHNLHQPFIINWNYMWYLSGHVSRSIFRRNQHHFLIEQILTTTLSYNRKIITKKALWYPFY